MLERAERDDENLDIPRSRVTRLEALPGERERELERVRAALETFRIRYRQE